MFLSPNPAEMNNHSILPELHHSSNYALLIINISIEEEFIQENINDSREKKRFITKFIKVISNLVITNISDNNSLEYLVQEYINISESIWYKHSKMVNISKQSKD